MKLVTNKLLEYNYIHRCARSVFSLDVTHVIYESSTELSSSCHSESGPVYLSIEAAERLNQEGGPAYVKHRCGTSLFPFTDPIIETQQVRKAFWVL